MSVDGRMTTSTPELQGIKLPADGGPALRVRVSLVVKNDPVARSTTTGTRVCELDCENDDEERVRISVWREHADKLAEIIKSGDLVQFSGLSAKKIFSARYAYGALPYAFHYGNGSNFTVVAANYRQTGMPVTAVADLTADIDFLQHNLADPRVRIRRIKARVVGNGLSPFCQGVVGPVVAYDQFDHSNTLSLKLQIEFVPGDKRKSLTSGTLLEMRGMVALPQLEGEYNTTVIGDPAEFRVARFDDVNLFDNGLGPWLAGGNTREQAALTDVVPAKYPKQPVAAASSPKPLPSSAASVEQVIGTELTKLKGIVLENFVLDQGQGTYTGSVYVKDLRSDVAVTVHDAPSNAKLAYKEGLLLEMRGVLYDAGEQKRVDVAWPQIAKPGKLPLLVQPSLPPAAQRAYATDLQSESSGLKVVTGKLLAEGEQRGTKAYFDVFVKDLTGKCVVTVAVIGDHRDVDVAACIGKDVDWKGVMKNNAAGDLEFVVAGWSDVIPSGFGAEKRIPESPSIVALNKNFDFMSTGSPTAKGTVAAGPSAPNATSDATAVVVVNVGPVKDSETPASVFTSSIKEEKLADVTNDPSFNAMHSGGGQIPDKGRRSSSTVMQRPLAPPPRPRSARKCNKSVDPGLNETPTKKAKTSGASKGGYRRNFTWQQELQDLKNAEVAAGISDENNGDASLSSTATFSDAASSLPSSSKSDANRQLDFSAFIDDEAKEVKNGDVEEEEHEEEEGEE